ncbi:hypothetical protein LEMLEM_LOCUS12600 [Lemmus lemmus]
MGQFFRSLQALSRQRWERYREQLCSPALPSPCSCNLPGIRCPGSGEASSPDCFLNSPSPYLTRTEEETNLKVDEVRVLVRGKWSSIATTFGFQEMTWHCVPSCRLG